jgi:uncharacterized protein DUF4193
LEEDEDFSPDANEEEEDGEPGDEEVEAEPDEGGDISLEEVLTRKPEEAPAPEEEEEEESVLTLGREEPVETLSVRVKPIEKDSEFVCQKCYLVKPIRSQLADKKRMYCRDCA